MSPRPSTRPPTTGLVLRPEEGIEVSASTTRTEPTQSLGRDKNSTFVLEITPRTLPQDPKLRPFLSLGRESPHPPSVFGIRSGVRVPENDMSRVCSRLSGPRLLDLKGVFTRPVHSQSRLPSPPDRPGPQKWTFHLTLSGVWWRWNSVERKRGDSQRVWVSPEDRTGRGGAIDPQSLPPGETGRRTTKGGVSCHSGTPVPLPGWVSDTRGEFWLRHVGVHVI